MSINTYFEEVSIWPRNAKVVRAYVIGFIVSLVCTIGAYLLVLNQVLSMPVTVAALLVFAVLQFITQLIYFLHVSFEKDPAARERLVILAGTLFIVGVLVAGSIWIMYTLNARMMLSPEEMKIYMSSQSGI